MDNLQDLRLLATPVCGMGLSLLKGLKSLSSVALGPGISSAGFVHVSCLTTLQHIKLADCALLESLEGMRKLQNLREVEFIRC